MSQGTSINSVWISNIGSMPNTWLRIHSPRTKIVYADTDQTLKTVMSNWTFGTEITTNTYRILMVGLG